MYHFYSEDSYDIVNCSISHQERSVQKRQPYFLLRTDAPWLQHSAHSVPVPCDVSCDAVLALRACGVQGPLWPQRQAMLVGGGGWAEIPVRPWRPPHSLPASVGWCVVGLDATAGRHCRGGVQPPYSLAGEPHADHQEVG